MKLYLVRHGQSAGNFDGFHQDKNTPLTNLGIQQAHKLAQRFKTIPVDVIVSSHYMRAHDTAKIIAQEIKKPIVINELFRERKIPSKIEGKSTSDIVAVSIIKMLKVNMHDSNWHHSDEENIYDLIFRAKKVITYLANHNENNILAVSHGRIIQAIIGVVVFNELLNPITFEMIKENMYLSNTGITVLEKIKNGWRLLTWNDDAHLGSV